MYELDGDYMMNDNISYTLETEDMDASDYALATLMGVTSAATVGLIMYAAFKDAPEHSHKQEDNNTSDYHDNNRTYKDDDILNPANPVSPLSPLNPVNPANPANPLNPLNPY